ncbi:MAG: helix-turn-helix domain-containing protein [Pirellulales bacterium]|nr:helix-turn-helix domain-containing protein [Pirellulales bacterium]
MRARNTDLPDGVPRLALSPREAAAALGIGSKLLWSKTKAGEIPHVKIGGRIIYGVADLEAWIASQSVPRVGGAR